jgi:hypothetical protein
LFGVTFVCSADFRFSLSVRLPKGERRTDGLKARTTNKNLNTATGWHGFRLTAFRQQNTNNRCDNKWKGFYERYIFDRLVDGSGNDGLVLYGHQVFMVLKNRAPPSPQPL